MSINGYEGYYEVSDLGRVKSLERLKLDGRKIRGYLLKPSLKSTGYLYITLYKNGKSKQFRINRLVAEAFIPNPLLLPTVNHKDGKNKWDNSVGNLEWATHEYQNRHAYLTGLNKGPQGSKQGNSKLYEEDIPRIFEMRKQGMLQREIGELLNVRSQQISRILNKKRWQHLTI